MSAWNIAADATFGAHAVSRSADFVSGLNYSLCAYVRTNGHRYLRAYFPSERFPDSSRAATFDMTTAHAPTSIQGGVTATLDLISGGLYLLRMTARANSTGAGNFGFQLNGGAGSTSDQTTGNGTGGMIISEPWIEGSDADVQITGPMPPSAAVQQRAGDDIYLTNVPGGIWDVLLECGNGVTTWLHDVAVTEESEQPGLLLPPLPDGSHHLRRATIWQDRRLPDGYYSRRVTSKTPAPLLLALRSSTGLTVAGTALTRWDSADGAPGYADQADSTVQCAVVTLAGRQLVRADPGDWMTVRNVTLPDPTTFTVMGAFRSLATGAQTILGCADQTNCPQIDTGAVANTVRLLTSSGLSVESQVFEDDGQLVHFCFAVKGDVRALGLGPDPTAEPGSIGPAMFRATPSTFELFRRAVGSQMANLYLAELNLWGGFLSEAQRTAEMTAMRTRLSGFTGVPASFNVSFGGVTHNSVEVRADVSGTSVAKLVIATDQAATNRVYVSAPVAPTPLTYSSAVIPSASSTGIVRVLKVRATGLPSGANLWLHWELDGVVNPGAAIPFKTDDVPGVARAHSFVATSCRTPSTTRNSGTLPMMASLGADFLAFIGDMDYANSYAVTPEYMRHRGLRYFMRNPGGKLVARALPIDVAPDNHDTGWAGFDAMVVYNGNLGADIAAATRQAYSEIVPSHVLADPVRRRVLSRYKDKDAVRYIYLDTQSQKTNVVPFRTVLGNPSINPDHFDQIAWCLNLMSTARAAGMNRIIIFSSNGIDKTPNYGRWPGIAPQELGTLYDAAVADKEMPPVAFWTGDFHTPWMDDGGDTDFSTNGATIIVGCSTPTFNGSGSMTLFANRSWNGVKTAVQTTRMFHHVLVAADGHLTVNQYRRTASSATTITLQETYRTADLVPAIQPVATALTPYGLVKMTKPQQSMGKAQVNYAWQNGAAAAGVLTMGANQKFERIPSPKTPGNHVLTLSNPVNCALPVTSFAITVADDAALLAYLAAGPSGADNAWRAIYRDLYYGLKDDGVLDQLDVLLLNAAGDAALARTNLVNPALYGLAAVGTLTHAPGVGLDSDGTGYLTSTYDPAAGGTKASRYSNSMMAWQTTGVSSDAFVMGNSEYGFTPRNAGGALSWRDASVSVNTLLVGAATGRTVVSRTSDNLVTLYRDGQAIGTHGRVTWAPTPGSPWTFFRRTDDAVSNTENMAVMAAGAGLTAAQVAKLDARVVAAVTAAQALANTPLAMQLVEPGSIWGGMSLTRASTAFGDVP
jgi:hypothetical protein